VGVVLYYYYPILIYFGFKFLVGHFWDIFLGWQFEFGHFGWGILRL